jgi:hypothetical protein
MFSKQAFGIYDASLRWRWYLVRDLVMRWSFVPLLAENVQVILHLCEPRSLPVDGLPVSFGTLNYSLPSHNGFLFLLEPLNLLLDSD